MAATRRTGSAGMRPASSPRRARTWAAVLADAATLKDPLLREWTGDVALDEFLFSHEERPPARARGTVRYGRRLLHAWEEVEVKARWLHHLGVGTLLELHELIEREFAAQVPAAAEPAEGIPPLIPPPLPGLDDADVIDLEPAPHADARRPEDD